MDGAEAVRTFDVATGIDPLPDPVEQWLDWEQQANLVGFRTSTRPIDVEVAAVPRDDVEIHVLPGAPRSIVDRFIRGDEVRFPRHPLNRDANVAWFDAPASERWSARFTASRTLAMPGPESGAALFSLKLSTDHPHPDFYQPEKTKLREEGLWAVDCLRVFDRIDGLLPPLEVAVLVREVLVVLARGGETGFLVRDLRRFQDGHYYLPALSVPWVGRQIAARRGIPFDRFWGDAFARPIGRAKAELFARYGLWFETPNPQNIVIQLDRSLAPTGRLLFRDLGDGECATDSCESTQFPWTRLRSDVRPETQNSFWAFSEAGGHSVDGETLERWYRQHDVAYFGELSRWFPRLAPDPRAESTALLDHWNAVLRSDAGSEAIVARFRALA